MNCCSRLPLLCAVALFAAPLPAGQPKRLTNDGLLKRDPVYVEQGGAIVYSVRHSSPQMVLMRLDLADNAAERLFPKSNLVEFGPAFSADGKVISLMRMTGNDQLAMIVGNAAGGELRELKASRKVAWNGTITRDGRVAVYNLSGQLYRRNLETDEEVQLTKSAGRNDWPAVSPDGKRIAFVSSRDGDYEIYVMELDGSDARRITTSRGLDMRPRWSPSGEYIAFTSNRHGNYEIFVMHADGSNPRRLTTHEERDDYPAWHPDGKRVVIVSERDGEFDLYEIPAE